MQNPLFYGAATALVTPFRGNRIDFDALEKLIDRQIDAGIDALVLLGTTGEPASVTPPSSRTPGNSSFNRPARLSGCITQSSLRSMT